MSSALPALAKDDRSRAAHTAPLAAFENLWTAPWELLRDIEVVPNCPMSADVFELPLTWMSAKRNRPKYRRTIDFRRAVPQGIECRSDLGLALMRRAKRIAVILLVTPTVTAHGRRTQPGGPDTWRNECCAFIPVIAWIENNTEQLVDESSCPDGAPVFRRLTKTSAEVLRSAPGYRNFWKGGGAQKLSNLARMGVIDDWPASDIGLQKEPKRRGAVVPHQEVGIPRLYRPLSDDFTARIGKVALWTAQTLGPQVLECLQSVLEITGNSEKMQTKLRRQAIEIWAATHPSVLGRFPFSLPSLVRGRAIVDSWPPRDWAELRRLASRLQTAHWIIIALATGAREGELMALSRDCLTSVGAQDLLVGSTFKTSDAADGETRHWPLPKVAVMAIRQQMELASILAPDGGHLWMTFTMSTTNAVPFAELLSINQSLASFGSRTIVDGKSLADWCEDGNVHPHRFRKTVARLAALSLVGATSILFEILGHRDPQMTINYILSDPGLQDEIRKIASEATVALAREAIEGSAENGGPAAPLVEDLKLRWAGRSGESELGTDSLSEAAEVLSMNGEVSMVRPGVLCTKTLGQRGPCTKRAGLPDVANCSPGCDHRLDLAAASEDCAKVIEQILVEIPPADGSLIRGWWQAQLVAQLQRFPQIRKLYLPDQRVQLALQGVAPVTLAQLAG